MRRSTALAVTLAALLAPAPGRAQEATAAGPDQAQDAIPPAPAAEPRPLAAAPRALPMLGLALGGGFPDLANLNVLFRPAPWLRLYGGPCWGWVAWGAQVGAAVAPWNGVVTPTLSLQAGELFGASLRRFVSADSQAGQDLGPLLGKVDYRYLEGDLGLEFGSPRGFAFYLRLGLAIVAIRANGSATHAAEDGARVTLRDPSLTAWLPSLKLGFQYWL